MDLKQTPVFSIVIASYNADKHLPKLISTIPQAADVEIVVVNDGSKDYTLQVCEDMQKSYPSMRVVSQPNKGVSAARNRGIHEAKGEWIIFADADDWFDTEALCKLVDNIKQGIDAEMLTFGIRFNNPEGIKEQRVIETVYTAEEFVKSTGLFQHASWNYVFCRNVIMENELKFPTFIRNTEDQDFNMKYLACINEVRSLDVILYNYNRFNESSASSQSRKEDWVKANLLSINDVLQFYKNKGKDTALLIYQAGRMYDDFMRDYSSPMTMNERARFFKEQYTITCRLLPRFASIKKYKLCNVCMPLGVLMFRLHKKLKG